MAWIDSFLRRAATVYQRPHKLHYLATQSLGRPGPIGYEDLLPIGVLEQVSPWLLPRHTQNLERGKVLPSHGCGFNRRRRRAFNNEAVEILRDQDQHRLGNATHHPNF